jgi:hypothetical protein
MINKATFSAALMAGTIAFASMAMAASNSSATGGMSTMPPSASPTAGAVGAKHIRPYVSLRYEECSGVETNYEDPACERPDRQGELKSVHNKSVHQQIGAQSEDAGS